MTTTLKNIVKELEKIQNYLWKNSSSKIKHKSLCYDNKAGGLKTVDIPYKITALQCPWNNSFIKWKLIWLYLIEK